MRELGPSAAPGPAVSVPHRAWLGALVSGLGWTEGRLHGFLRGRAVCRVTVNSQTVPARELQDE